MKKVSEYLKHAQECRDMATSARPKQRKQLEEMALTWEQLADARQKQIVKSGKANEESAAK